MLPSTAPIRAPAGTCMTVSRVALPKPPASRRNVSTSTDLFGAPPAARARLFMTVRKPRRRKASASARRRTTGRVYSPDRQARPTTGVPGSQSDSPHRPSPVSPALNLQRHVVLLGKHVERVLSHVRRDVEGLDERVGGHVPGLQRVAAENIFTGGDEVGVVRDGTSRSPV